jgi:SNF2 family DNA or RNA helicase
MDRKILAFYLNDLNPRESAIKKLFERNVKKVIVFCLVLKTLETVFFEIYLKLRI